jgi:CRP-like cAMP-binding protein
MSDRNPTVLRRMLALRQFPLFSGAELDELVTLADNVVEMTLPAGAVVAAAGAHLPSLHCVVEGRIESANAAWGPRDVCGVLEVLARREPAVPAVAVVETRTLQLSGGELGEVLEDNFGVLLSVLRELAGRVLATTVRPGRPAPRLASTGPLGLVERLIVLRRQVPFAKARLQALATLAQASEELTLPAGAVLTRAGEPATGAIVIIDGALQGRRLDGDAVAHGAGDAIGLFETLAGTHYTATIEASTPVRALASSSAALLDVIEDHTDVGLAMLATFARSLLGVPASGPGMSGEAWAMQEPQA